ALGRVSRGGRPGVHALCRTVHDTRTARGNYAVSPRRAARDPHRGAELPRSPRVLASTYSLTPPCFRRFSLCFLQLKMTSEEEVDATVVRALKAYKATPRSFLRRLRLCSVTSPDLCP